MPYGAYSLIASSAVLQHLADGLELEDHAGYLANGRRRAGTIAWQGCTYALGVLRPATDLHARAAARSA